jgi:hypothetical protein
VVSLKLDGADQLRYLINLSFCLNSTLLNYFSFFCRGAELGPFVVNQVEHQESEAESCPGPFPLLKQLNQLVHVLLAELGVKAPVCGQPDSLQRGQPGAEC